MKLTEKELEELSQLRNKASYGNLNPQEINRMIELINKSESPEFNNYLKNIGYSDVNQYKKDAENNEDLIKSLLIIVGAIILIGFFGRFFKK